MSCCVDNESDRSIVATDLIISVITVAGIVLHFIFKYGLSEYQDWPLFFILIVGGVPLIIRLLRKALAKEYSNDLIAGISIITAIILGEYLAATIVVLMLSGGEALEHYAVQKASGVLRALADRMPSTAHKVDQNTGVVTEIQISQIKIGDAIFIPPHTAAPVDGIVATGRGEMDESFLTGEPFRISKIPGSEIISGAMNGNIGLTVTATKLPSDSRYAKIVEVIRLAEQRRPKMRRYADRLGALYTPLALLIGILAFVVTGDPRRFLSVIIIATPCPLLIAIPVAIIGSISLAARRGIIIRDPSVMERVSGCKTIILDKTGTLTYGTPVVSDAHYFNNYQERDVLPLVAAIEQYSKHPLAGAIIDFAKNKALHRYTATTISERPGEGLSGIVENRKIRVTSRKSLTKAGSLLASQLEEISGLECVVLVDDLLAAQYVFRDKPREDGRAFVEHLSKRHGIDRVMIVSGDRRSEVEHLATHVGIQDVYADKSPEEKLAIVEAETARAKTIYVGDGINDAPALVQATVGVAFGGHSSVTAESAGAIVLDSSLKKLDEFLHISKRMQRIAGESAIGGMAASTLGMILAAFGYVTPVMGALSQEIIDLVAVLNALRAAFPTRRLNDFEDLT